MFSAEEKQDLQLGFKKVAAQFRDDPVLMVTFSPLRNPVLSALFRHLASKLPLTTALLSSISSCAP